jgi:hypothetical protein
MQLCMTASTRLGVGRVDRLLPDIPVFMNSAGKVTAFCKKPVTDLFFSYSQVIQACATTCNYSV